MRRFHFAILTILLLLAGLIAAPGASLALAPCPAMHQASSSCVHCPETSTVSDGKVHHGIMNMAGGAETARTPLDSHKASCIVRCLGGFASTMPPFVTFSHLRIAETHDSVPITALQSVFAKPPHTPPRSNFS